MAEYIEREALLERIDDIWDCADLVFEPNDHCCRADDCASCKWAETKEAIRKIAANFPDVDVRPVVRCGVCELHGHCYTENVFAFARLAEENRFCAVGKVKTNGEEREES